MSSKYPFFFSRWVLRYRCFKREETGLLGGVRCSRYHLMGLSEHLRTTCQWGLCSLIGSELGVSGWELPEATQSLDLGLRLRTVSQSYQLTCNDISLHSKKGTFLGICSLAPCPGLGVRRCQVGRGGSIWLWGVWVLPVTPGWVPLHPQVQAYPTSETSTSSCCCYQQRIRERKQVSPPTP